MSHYEADALLAKMMAERAAEIAAMPPPSEAEVIREAAFLRGWSKGKRITPYGAGSTFHKCGKWMTKLPPKMVDALLSSGLATGTPSGFTMVKAGKTWTM